MMKPIAGVAVAAVLALSAACQTSEEATNAPAANTNAGGQVATNAAPTNTAPPVTPGSPEDIIANQPDFTADVTINAANVSYTGKMAKRGSNFRAELSPGKGVPAPAAALGRLVQIARPGEPTLIFFPDQKTYVEAPVTASGSPADAIGSFLQRMQTEQGFRIEEAGSEVVEGHDTRKFRIVQEGKNTEVVAYAAKDLNNLIVKVDGRIEGQPISVTMTNVSLTVPDNAFDPPANYQTEYKRMDPAAMMGGGASAPAPANANANANANTAGGAGAPPANRP